MYNTIVTLLCIYLCILLCYNLQPTTVFDYRSLFDAVSDCAVSFRTIFYLLYLFYIFYLFYFIVTSNVSRTVSLYGIKFV